MTCAVAFFGCSCSLTDDSESSEPKRSSVIEKSVTTPSAQDVENDKDYADVRIVVVLIYFPVAVI